MAILAGSRSTALRRSPISIADVLTLDSRHRAASLAEEVASAQQMDGLANVGKQHAILSQHGNPGRSQRLIGGARAGSQADIGVAMLRELQRDCLGRAEEFQREDLLDILDD